ncbi:HEPN domain-containing protein [Exiguobacterium undae]|uniref:HEPN domain-containing protein n=1 Tax=Exiguobacterium undae TaxID=169177 RepID=UPI00047ADE5C|nr:HEPN domain-containing protein [Exiguobacterium undae]
MSNQKINVEYLLILEGKDNFCSNNLTFDNFLMTNSDLSLKGDYIEYKELKVEYKVQFEEMEDNKRSIHVYFSCENEVDINQYEQFLRVIRSVFYKISKDIHTLRDDISFHYAQLAYPKIHQTENLMRKLITKFMIINVGLSWTEKHVPKEVKDAPGNSKEKSNVNYLYTLDFIQLSNILFKEYSPFNTSELLEKIKNSDNNDDVPLTYLKKFVPASNWERYFSEIVDSEAEYLKNRWTELYSFRNQVAHNNILSKDDYEKIDRYVTEIKEKLDKAIKNIDKIKVSDEEKEIISSNIILEDKNDVLPEFNSEFNTLKKYFLNSYWIVDEILAKIILKNLNESIDKDELMEIVNSSLEEKVEKLEKEEVLVSEKLLLDFKNIIRVRNFLIHVENSDIIEENDIIGMRNSIKKLKRLKTYLEAIYV